MQDPIGMAQIQKIRQQISSLNLLGYIVEEAKKSDEYQADFDPTKPTTLNIKDWYVSSMQNYSISYSFNILFKFNFFDTINEYAPRLDLEFFFIYIEFIFKTLD